MTPTERALCCAIRAHPRYSTADFARALGWSSRGSAGNVLRRLVAKGLVQNPHNKDRCWRLAPHVATGWVQGEPWVGVVRHD